MRFFPVRFSDRFVSYYTHDSIKYIYIYITGMYTR